jgi:hypothetical protein
MQRKKKLLGKSHDSVLWHDVEYEPRTGLPGTVRGTVPLEPGKKDGRIGRGGAGRGGGGDDPR